MALGKITVTVKIEPWFLGFLDILHDQLYEAVNKGYMTESEAHEVWEMNISNGSEEGLTAYQG